MNQLERVRALIDALHATATRDDAALWARRLEEGIS